MLRKTTILILLSLISSWVFINQEACAFSVEPARIELTIRAGRQKGKMVTIDNSKSDEPVHLKIYVQDIMYMPDGSYDFPDAGSTSWSCADWIKIIPEEIDIPARKKQRVRVSVSVPKETQGGYYSMVFFESSPTYIEGLGINFRIGALTDVTVHKTALRKAELANMDFGKPDNIEIEIFNQGNVLLRPKGRIKILGAKGKRRIKQLKFNPQRLSILPNTLRKFSQKLDVPLDAGSYRIKAEIDYGTKYLLVGELPIKIE